MPDRLIARLSAEAALEAGGDPAFLEELHSLWELHVEKSSGYGTTEDRYANFTGVSAVTGEPADRYPRRRMVEKLTRAENLDQAGRDADIVEELRDIAGSAICALVLLRRRLASSSQ